MKNAMCPECGFVEEYNKSQIKYDMFLGKCANCGTLFDIIGFKPLVDRNKIEIKECKAK